MAEKYYYNVKNRSASTVLYKIPESGIRRTFAPGEVKRIDYDELLHLSYQPGGRELMASFLQIQSEGVLKSLNIKTEPEYNMNEQQVVDLLLHGSLDEFLDCLDFAPTGVIELIKKFAFQLPLSDYEKRKALKNKTYEEVEELIDSGLEPTTEEKQEVAVAATPPSSRRTTGDKYKVVSKG